MENREQMSIEQGGDALRNLAEELDATHAAPFRACFFDEHWEAIERTLDRMVNGLKICQISDYKRR